MAVFSVSGVPSSSFSAGRGRADGSSCTPRSSARPSRGPCAAHGISRRFPRARCGRRGNRRRGRRKVSAWNFLVVFYEGASAPGVPRLRVQQRNVLVVRRLGQRLQVGVDVGEIVVREDGLGVRRHGAVGMAHEHLHEIERLRVGRELGAGGAALPGEAVAFPAAVLNEGGLAFFGRAGGECEGDVEQRRSQKQILRRARNERRLHRGCVQTLSSAGWPDFTTAIASFSAGASSAGSLIGPFAHQPMLSASLWYSMSGFMMLVPTGPKSLPLLATRLRKLDR